MKIAFLAVGGEKDQWLTEVHEIYKKKISGFLDFESQQLKPVKKDRASALEKQKAESDLILKHLKPGDLVVLCDEKGAIFDSVQFSKRLVGWLETSPKRVVFVIGGAFGVTDEVKTRAKALISLSPMTLNHHMAQAVLCEQVYRALTIWRKIPYHNA